MLSALKNFLITFLVAALVFGTAAYFATRYLTTTITSIFDAEASELEGILNPTDSSTGTPADPNAGSTPISGENAENVQGNSFNMLFIVTDYQPDLFSDYAPDRDTLKEMEENLSTDITGVLGSNYRRVRAVATVLFRADKERKEFTYTVFPASTRISTSSGDQYFGDLYNLYGKDYIINTVASMTGVPIDYHMLVNVTELYDIVNEMGGFSLYLTKELYYNGQIATSQKPSADEANSLPLLYSIGQNTIDGAGSIALMMWEDNSSAAALSDRNPLLVSVLCAVMDKLTGLSQAEFTDFYDSICERKLIDTNFTTKDLVSRMGLICAVKDGLFTEKTLTYPGRYVAASDTEDAYFSADMTGGFEQFKNYRRLLVNENG